MIEYGKRLSKTPKINYKNAIYLLPFIIVISIIISFYIGIISLFLGFCIIIFIIFASTQFDQFLNHEAYENGLMIPTIGRYYRSFIPYNDIEYICEFNIKNRIRFYPSSKYEGLLIIFIKKHYRNKNYQFYALRNTPQTPFDLVIPQMKMHLKNWEQIYYPEICLTSDREIMQLYQKWNKENARSPNPRLEQVGEHK
ncbi:MAG: hypothetical protein ACW98D_18325 [Promethearchaeota archaeon]|jgi:hypothetical protein